MGLARNNWQDTTGCSLVDGFCNSDEDALQACCFDRCPEGFVCPEKLMCASATTTTTTTVATTKTTTKTTRTTTATPRTTFATNIRSPGQFIPPSPGATNSASSTKKSSVSTTEGNTPETDPKIYNSQEPATDNSALLIGVICGAVGCVCLVTIAICFFVRRGREQVEFGDQNTKVCVENDVYDASPSNSNRYANNLPGKNYGQRPVETSGDHYSTHI